MARLELSESHYADLGEGPANANTLLDHGMMYSVGRSVPIDYVTAHKWFNLAAMRGKFNGGGEIVRVTQGSSTTSSFLVAGSQRCDAVKRIEVAKHLVPRGAAAK